MFESIAAGGTYTLGVAPGDRQSARLCWRAMLVGTPGQAIGMLVGTSGQAIGILKLISDLCTETEKELDQL